MYACIYICLYYMFIDAYSIDMHRFLGGSGAKLAGGIPATSGHKRWTLSLSGHETRHRELTVRRSSRKKHQEAMQLFARKHTFFCGIPMVIMYKYIYIYNTFLIWKIANCRHWVHQSPIGRHFWWEFTTKVSQPCSSGAAVSKRRRLWFLDWRA